MTLLFEVLLAAKELFTLFAVFHIIRVLLGGRVSFNVFGVMAMVDTDWSTGKQHQTCSPGIALVTVTGTGVTWQDIYEDPALKEIYIFKRSPHSDSEIAGGGYFDAYISLYINPTGTTLTDLTIKSAVIRLYGRIKLGASAFDPEVSTLTLGEKGTNSRKAGVTLIQMGWRGQQNQLNGASVFQGYDSQLMQTSSIIKAAALNTDADLNEVAWGDDYNFIFQCKMELERFSIRYGEKLRFANAATVPWETDKVVVTNVAEIESFYNSASTLKHQYDKWEMEEQDIPMRCANNAQQSENGFDQTWNQCTVIDAQTAEAAVENPVHTNFNAITVVGGTASNDDFTVKLTTGYTAVTYDRAIRMWFPVSVLVLDNATGNPISGARVRMYINSGTSTLGQKTDFTQSTITLDDWDETTDANGEVAATPLLKKFYNSDTPANATRTFSAHVAAGTLTETDRSPFTLSIQATGYRTYQAIFNLDEEKRVVVGLDPPATNPDNVLL